MDIIEKAADSYGDAPLLLSAVLKFSFREFENETARIASLLSDRGAGRGKRVALIAPNSPELLLVLGALLRLDSVAAPINHRFPTEYVEGILSRLDPALTILDPKVFIAPEGLHALSISSLSDLANGTLFQRDDPVPDSNALPVSIIHTSASSGRPKAAVHSLWNHLYSAMGSNRNLPFMPGDCWLLSLPLYHIGGYSMLFRTLLGGGALAVPGSESSLETSLAVFPVTHLSLVPTQLYRLLQSTRGKMLLAELKAVLLGGSAVAEPLLDNAVHAGVPIHLTYGSTEMSSQVTTSERPITAAVRDSGTILPWRDVSIACNGEILVKGPCLFMGYLKDGNLNPARDADGWFHTGDAGELSEEGRLTVLGRRDSMFVAGGENIHPEEIEKALTAVPGVEEALVAPAPDTEYGMRPVAWIMVNEAAPEDAIILDETRKQVGRLKTPVRLTRITEWVTVTGSAKIDRNWYRRLADT